MIIDIHSLKIFATSVKAVLNVWKWGGRLKYAYNFFFAEPYYVLVYGASGAGKSEFCRAFLEKPVTEVKPKRTHMYEEFDWVFEDGNKIRFLDLPGNKVYEDRRNKVLKKISKKNYGIINVVSYGYHEAPGARDVKIFKVPNDASEKIPVIDTQYHKLNLDMELEQAKEWIKCLGDSYRTNLRWVVTVLNKADVWWNDIDMIRNYYSEDGAYSKAVYEKHGSVQIDAYPYCSIIEPFGSKPMVLTFGERDKIKMHRILKEDLLKLIKEDGQE